MNIEKFREYCLSLPQVTEDFPFDDDVLTFRVCNKIFACIAMSNPELAV
ncbi:MAG: MmcQ/YjbR family DNA-binding protein, partial [Bacteroidales bacterium]|nr:MmcQ/YjbR family DNA-binding protein [Bacteroidales bacterium]